ncbi:hypothetical protein Zmor_020064 [Zophobas morio]|uniref:Uncharacterized protein n=1 Tax=Zophobas morio TaxID=2755281 RepID=A0AA38M9L0_9CUCU|nr:hypothetical protein Zmor_020064 [Zophobas morio]
MDAARIMNIEGSKGQNAFNENNHAEAKNNSVANAPPPTPLNKTKLTTGTVQGPMIKKDKRHSSSRFNITKNRELEMLPSLKGADGLRAEVIRLGEVADLGGGRRLWRRCRVGALGRLL